MCAIHVFSDSCGSPNRGQRAMWRSVYSKPARVFSDGSDHARIRAHHFDDAADAIVGRVEQVGRIDLERARNGAQRARVRSKLPKLDGHDVERMDVRAFAALAERQTALRAKFSDALTDSDDQRGCLWIVSWGSLFCAWDAQHQHTHCARCSLSGSEANVLMR